jgi:hypothetical protein
MPRRVTHIQIYVLCLVILSSYLHQSLPSGISTIEFAKKKKKKKKKKKTSLLIKKIIFTKKDRNIC